MINRVENVLFDSEQVTVIVDRARAYSQQSTCFLEIGLYRFFACGGPCRPSGDVLGPWLNPIGVQNSCLVKDRGGGLRPSG